MKGRGPDKARALDLAGQLLAVVKAATERTVDPATGQFSLPGHSLAMVMNPGQMEIVYVVVKGALEPDMRCYPMALPAVIHTLVGFLAQLEQQVATRMQMTPDPLLGKGGSA